MLAVDQKYFRRCEIARQESTKSSPEKINEICEMAKLEKRDRNS